MRLPARVLIPILLALLLGVGWLSLASGPVSLSLDETLHALLTLSHRFGDPDLGQASLIIQQIRLPRVLLGGLVGAMLAAAGVAMQALFRNPLADPGLFGVSSGAALGAAIAIVLLDQLSPWPPLVPYLLSLCAFAGGLLVALVVYRLGYRDGRLDVPTMLLAGVALTALAGAAVGLLTYTADDDALRSLLFWNMGTLSGARYRELGPVILVAVLMLGWLSRQGDALNALLLGDAEARHLGFDVEQLKRRLVFFTALATGATVAATGLIGFVGLMVPHLMRLLTGPNHRALLPAAALAGASLLLAADWLARQWMSPAEVPIGIVTALLGAPFFLFLLRRAPR